MSLSSLGMITAASCHASQAYHGIMVGETKICLVANLCRMISCLAMWPVHLSEPFLVEEAEPVEGRVCPGIFYINLGLF